jgi:biotin operon repressor
MSGFVRFCPKLNHYNLLHSGHFGHMLLISLRSSSWSSVCNKRGKMALPPDLSGQALYRFIGGRRRINSQRRDRAVNRRYRLLFTWSQNPYMSKAGLARLLGVHRSTIGRDIAWLKDEWQQTRTCPFCGHHLPARNLPEEVEWLSGALRFLPPA